MTAAESTKLMQMLKAAYPRQTVTVETAQVYAIMLNDLDYPVAARAVKRLLSTSTFFPTIAELRESVAEESIAAPGDVAAWELVMQRVTHRPRWVECVACDESGYENIDEDRICPSCKGTGRFDADALPPLHPVVRHALEACGGVTAIREADKVSVIRAQFRDTYRDVRAESVRAIQTGEAPALPPTERLAIGPTVVPMPELRSVDA